MNGVTDPKCLRGETFESRNEGAVTDPESVTRATFESRNAVADPRAELAALGLATLPGRPLPKLRVVARRGRYGSVIAESEDNPENLVRGWLQEEGGVLVADKAWRVGACSRCAAPLVEEIWRRHGGIGLCRACAHERRYYSWYGPRPCASCGREINQEYTAVPRDVRYCQGECAARAARERSRVSPADRECEDCDCSKTFTPARSDSCYCSNACRQRAYRRRRSAA